MPVFTIQAPDGRKIKVEADDEETALAGAQHYASSAPKAPAQSSNPVLGYMERSEQAKSDRLAQMRANQAGAAGKPIFQPLKDLIAPGRQAIEAIKADYAAQAKPQPLPKTPGEFIDRYVSGAKDVLHQGQEFLGLLGAPFAGVTNQAVNPLARAGERLGVGDEAFNSGALNTALAGVRGTPAALKSAPRLPAAKPNPVGDIVEKFDRAGVQPSLATTGHKGTSAITNVIAENPVAGVPTRARLKAQAAQAGEAADRIAGQYGTVSAPQIAGENVQAGVNRFAKGRGVPGNASAPAGATSFSSKADVLYDDAFASIDKAQADKMGVRADNRALGGQKGVRPYSPVSAPQTEATLGILANRAGGEIGNLISDPKLSTIAGAVLKDRGVSTFGDLRALRTWVRTAQRDPQLRQGIDDAALQSLERSLTSDIMGNAESLAGPAAASKLRRADQYYAAGSKRIGDALQSFDNANSGESAYQRIIQAAGSTGSADAQRLLSLKRSLRPEEWGDVAANVLHGLGKPTPGQAGSEVGNFSVSTFLTGYNKLSPRAKDILFSSVGGGGAKAGNLRSELDNLAFVADRLKGVEKGANTSRTAVGGQAIATLGAGSLVSWPVTLKVLGTMAGAGEVLTNPAFVRWLAKTPATAAGARQHLGELDRLAKVSPTIAAYRQHLAESLVAENQKNNQPIGGDVPAPEMPEPVPAY